LILFDGRNEQDILVAVLKSGDNAIVIKASGDETTSMFIVYKIKQNSDVAIQLFDIAYLDNNLSCLCCATAANDEQLAIII
jgi:hypothetical protein